MEGSVTPDKPEAPDLASLKTMFQDAASLTADARKEGQTDEDYYDGKQLTPEEKRVLQKRKQPDIVFNRVKPAVNGTLGVIKQGSTDPKAYPATPKDEDSADVASKCLRFIADKNRFDALKIDVAKDFLVPGTGACIIEVDDDRQITVQQIRWEQFFYDPRSRRQDFQDARYMGVAKWMYADDVAALYPDKKEEITNAFDGSANVSDTFNDRPGDASTSVNWLDGRKRRILLVEMYHREGSVWNRCVYYAGSVLDFGPSPYHDAKGKPSNPIEAQSCFVDRENNRYGIVRDMRGPQDEINKRRSKLLHLVSARQVQSMTGAEAHLAMAADKAEVRTEAAKPDGVLPPGWTVVPTSDMAAGQAQLLAESKAEIERMAPSPSLVGRDAQSSSGRQQLIQQQAGMSEQAIIFGGIEEWELRVYRQMWNRARQFWTAPMFVRITDEDDSAQFVGINQPIPGPGQIVAHPETGMPMIQPTILGYKHALAEMDVDIIIETIPDTANLQQEQFQMLTDLAKVYGPQEVPFEDVLEASSMPNKRQIIEKRQQRMQQAQQDPHQALQLQGMAADIDKTRSEANLKKAQTVYEMQKPQLDALDHLQRLNQPAAGA